MAPGYSTPTLTIYQAEGFAAQAGSVKAAWSRPAHRHLDEAVFAAYGWKPDLSDEEILEKLLALNLARAKK